MASRGHSARNSSSRPVGYRFVGTPGSYIPGIPARDLSEAEAETFGEKIEAAARNGSVLYEAIMPEVKPVKENEDDG